MCVVEFIQQPLAMASSMDGRVRIEVKWDGHIGQGDCLAAGTRPTSPPTSSMRVIAYM